MAKGGMRAEGGGERGWQEIRPLQRAVRILPHSCYYCCRLGDFLSEPSPFRVASSDDNINIYHLQLDTILFILFSHF